MDAIKGPLAGTIVLLLDTTKNKKGQGQASRDHRSTVGGINEKNVDLAESLRRFEARASKAK